MKIDYLKSFRNPELIKKLAQRINKKLGESSCVLMEVCGGHTGAVFKFGLKNLLPENLNLLSGPGCPVCVTPSETIEQILWLSRQPDNIIVTFGDMVRVPGYSGSLESERGKGAKVEIIYNPIQSLKIAEENKTKNIILAGIGFETTAPITASVVIEAQKRNLNNFTLLSSHKVMPPAMEWLASSDEVKIDGFICPGHVSTIIGTEPYDFLAGKHGKACSIAGFEPTDILYAILQLITQITEDNPKVEIAYSRSVKKDGNPKAREIMNRVFKPVEGTWRGLGTIPESGLGLQENFAEFDTISKFKVPEFQQKDEKLSGCICSKVLRGAAKPFECPLFRKVCTPTNPVGACMVGEEGSCRIYYKYN